MKTSLAFLFLALCGPALALRKTPGKKCPEGEWDGYCDHEATCENREPVMICHGHGCNCPKELVRNETACIPASKCPVTNSTGTLALTWPVYPTSERFDSLFDANVTTVYIQHGKMVVIRCPKASDTANRNDIRILDAQYRCCKGLTQSDIGDFTLGRKCNRKPSCTVLTRDPGNGEYLVKRPLRLMFLCTNSTDTAFDSKLYLRCL